MTHHRNWGTKLTMQSSIGLYRQSTLIALRICIISLSLAPAAFTQDTPAPQAQQPAATNSNTTQTPQNSRDRIHITTAENIEEAWSLLTTAAEDSKHPDVRIQSLAALGTLGNDVRAEKLIAKAMTDPDVDVRTAACLAAGQTSNRNLIPKLHLLLDDNEPQVAFVTASTLWKMHDRSGEDILIAVIDGERRANPGVVHGTMHSVKKGLHNPAMLAKLGALQGSSILLGPFGFAIIAVEYVKKNEGGDLARVSAIDLVSQEKSTSSREALIAALDDKDPIVRAAAARALGSCREKSVSDALLSLFEDSKPPVRLNAAAAYIRSTQPAPKPRSTPRKS
jgi:hypothetical protein